MMNVRRVSLLALVLAILPVAARAHHGQAMYDDKETTVQGVVKEFQYTNPHSWLLFDVTSKDGSVTTWGFEAEGPNALLRNGIHKSDFAPGTKVTITTHAMRNGQPAGMWLKAVRDDGKEFDPRLRPASGAAPAPVPAPAAK
jgi:hypothetical protein